jgi:hypothetical protein
MDYITSLCGGYFYDIIYTSNLLERVTLSLWASKIFFSKVSEGTNERLVFFSFYEIYIGLNVFNKI